tara:strand:- start:15220 stop:15804 length:585 start_codon:yes stop_codon:yes gene_type:complete
MELLEDLGMIDTGEKKRVRFGLYKCGFCGNEKEVRTADVKRRTKSCGCKKGNNTHQLTNHPLYSTWAGMKARCLNPKNNRYKDYGGRGIAVCFRWRESLLKFIGDMGERPKNMTLERIENDKGYYKENCRWATRKEQGNNRRTNVQLSAYGVTQNITEWCKTLEIPEGRVRTRIRKYGWSHHDALFIPKGGKRG